MKYLGTLAAVLALSACASSPPASPSYTVHNPEIFGSAPPSKDDDGNPYPYPQKSTSKAWFEGNGRMID